MAKITYYPLCPTDDLTTGDRMFVEIGKEPVVVFNLAGEYFAIADLCTHDMGSLGEGEVEGYEIICPRHGARFDLRTGEVLTLPAVKEVPSYPLRVTDGILEIGIEED